MKTIAVAALALLGAPLGALPAAWFERGLPVTPVMRRVSVGELRINLTRAHYFLFSGAVAGESGRLAEERGWRPDDSKGKVLEAPSGAMAIRLYRRTEEDRILLLVEPVEGKGHLAMAVLEREPRWQGEDGEAPGREPGGIPRFASARRTLHVAIGPDEAAWYFTREAPEKVLESAHRALTRRGWSVSGPDSGPLIGVREGHLIVTVHARERDGGTVYLIIATRRGN